MYATFSLLALLFLTNLASGTFATNGTFSYTCNDNTKSCAKPQGSRCFNGQCKCPPGSSVITDRCEAKDCSKNEDCTRDSTISLCDKGKCKCVEGSFLELKDNGTRCIIKTAGYALVAVILICIIGVSCGIPTCALCCFCIFWKKSNTPATAQSS